MVDSISGLASADYRHDEWGVDVTISGSQKGLMLPPGLGFNALSPRAIAASRPPSCPLLLGLGRNHRDEQDGYFPYTPDTNLLYGLHEALEMIRAKAWTTSSRATSAGRRRARRGDAWGLPVQCADKDAAFPGADRHDRARTASMPTLLRKTILQRFDLSLGTGLGKLKGRTFRIGHLGNSNDLTLLATLAGCEMGLKLAASTWPAAACRPRWNISPASGPRRGAAQPLM